MRESAIILPEGEYPKGTSGYIEVRSYMDARGWKYAVRSGIGGEKFKAFYQRPEYSGQLNWHGCRSLRWHRSAFFAQFDLDAYAYEKGMVEWIPEPAEGRKWFVIWKKEDGEP